MLAKYRSFATVLAMLTVEQRSQARKGTTMACNCFSLRNDGSVSEGIVYTPPNTPRSMFALEHQGKSVHMALVGEQGLPVQVQRKDGSLLLKEASVIGVGRPKLTGRAVWPKALLLVRTQSLDFRFSPTYLETQTNNAYPGAEGTTPHLIQMGHRRSHDQLQLVVMEPSVPVFVADIGARYMSFTWAGNAVQPAAPSMSEYGAFVIAYTRTILKRHPDLLWAKKTLQANGVGNMWPNDLANQLSELSREPRR